MMRPEYGMYTKNRKKNGNEKWKKRERKKT